MNEYEKYLNVIMAECIAPITEDCNNVLSKITVGERYRLGIRYNVLMQKEVYYLLDIKSPLGMPIYVEIESEYFKPEELSSISFILA